MAKKIKTPATSTSPLHGEVATTADGRDITRGFLPPGLPMPPEDEILRTRGGHYDVYRKVLLDDQVAATFHQRRLAVTGTEWRVKPGGEDAASLEAATRLEEMLRGIDLDAITDKMLYGLFYGYAVGECVWESRGNLVVLADILVRRQRRFVFGPTHEPLLLTMAHPLGEPLPPQKFWIFRTGAEHDDEPYGLGLAHWLYWPVFFKKEGVRAWMRFLDRFGSPTAKGKYPAGAGDLEKRKLLESLRAMRSDSGIIVPENMDVVLLEAAGSGHADYAGLIDLMNRAISKINLSQTMTSEAVGGQYKAEVQDGVRKELVKADANLVAGSFNRQVVTWLSLWNWPRASQPVFEFITDEPEDLDRRAAREKTVAETTGYRPTLAHVREVYGGDWTEKGEGQQIPMVAAGQEAQEAQEPHKAASFSEDDDLIVQDQVVIDQIDLSGFGSVMEPMLRPLMTALQDGVSPEEVMVKLGEAFPTMDDGSLVDLLTRLIFIADTWGRLHGRD